MKKIINSFTLIMFLGTFVFTSQVSAQMSGTYTVGTGGTYTTLTAAYNALVTSGINGPVTLSVISDLSGQQTLSGSVSGASTTNTITITSNTGNAASYTVGTASNYALYIQNGVNNVIVKRLTIGQLSNSAQYCGVYFYGNSSTFTNIEIRECNINSYQSATGSNYYSVYYNTGGSSYYANNISIKKNIIKGGYYNINLQYSAGNSTNISSRLGGVIIDSNELSEAYYYGMYIYWYSFVKSISHNSIISRNNVPNFYGIYAYALPTIDTMVGNKINMTALTTAYGIYCYTNLNYYGYLGKMFCANNEIVIRNCSGTMMGMYYLTYSRYDLFNNSVFLYGTGTAYGLYLQPDAFTPVIKNNLIHVNTSGVAYMHYISYPNTSYCTLDYNNFYRTGTGTTSYYGSTAYTTLAAWKTAYSQDLNSAETVTTFIDTTKNLDLLNYLNLSCPKVNGVNTDIRNKPRPATTYKGCYEVVVLDAQVAIDTNVSTQAPRNQPLPISVVLTNLGRTTLTSAILKLNFNGYTRTPLQWTGTLLKDSSIIINLGVVLPAYGNTNSAVVTVSNPNGTSDLYPYNDTATYAIEGLCDTTLSGTYLVGTGAEFSTINEAITVLNGCGMSGPVTLLILPGNYSTLSINGAINGSSETNTLTLTSYTGNQTDVVIGTAGTYAMILNGAKHLRFTNVSIGNTSNTTYGVYFQNTNENILFYGCDINSYTNATSSGYAGVYYSPGSGTNTLKNVNFIKNTINGGYYNFYFYYAGGSYTNMANMSVSIDSNTLQNSYYYAFYSQVYSQFNSISFNTITSRSSGSVSSYWYGIYLSDYISFGQMTGNKIRSTNTSIAVSYGIYLAYYINNYGSFSTSPVVANNELILYGFSQPYGIRSYYANCNIQLLHNSVYLYGTNNGYGLYVYNPTTAYKPIIKNNNFVTTTTSTSYPIYYNSSYYNTSYFTVDYNNYYSTSGYLGYAGTTHTSINSLRSYTGQDANSVSMNPGFVASPTNLIPVNWSACPTLTQVPTDIDAQIRMGSTFKGCYTTVFDNDAGINELGGIGTNVNAGTNLIKARIINYGEDTITNVKVQSCVDGIYQTPIYVTGLSLAPYQDTVISAGSFVATIGVPVNLKVWTFQPNGLPDQNTGNDTLSLVTIGCAQVLNGTYDIGGGNNDFATITAAMNVLTTCGVSGPVVFRLASGNYTSLNSISTVYPGTNESNTVTFTSLTGNAANVVIGNASGVALTLNGAKYLRFTNVSIGNTSNTNYGVYFQNTNENITFYGCTINSYTNATSSSYIGVYYSPGSGTNTLKNVNFIKNTINGGYYNFYFYYAGGSTSNLGNMNVTIDSNTMQNSYYYALRSYPYSQFNSISYNTITSRSSGSVSSYWYGIYLSDYASFGQIKGNKIRSTNASIYYPYGIYIAYYINNYGSFSTSPVVANNEIILYGYSQPYGIYLYYTNTNIQLLHNSVYLYGPNNGYGLYVYNPTTAYKPIIKNNNIVTATTYTSYPIYYNSYYNTSYFTVDYNNYYSTSGYVGYAGTTHTTLSSLRSYTGQDAHSVNVNPSYINVNNSLELLNNAGLKCVKMSSVPIDIVNISRKDTTTIGAYESIVFDLDVAALITPVSGSIICNQTSTPMQVSIANNGTDPLTMSRRPVNLHIRVTGANTYQKDTVLSSGVIPSMQQFNVLFSNPMTMTNPGTCYVSVFVNAIDGNTTNDTLYGSFYVISTHSYDTLTLCSTELPLQYGDSILTSAGNYSIHFQTINGCDSIVSLRVNVNPVFAVNDTITICNNQLPYNYHGTFINSAGLYNIHLTSAKGCDSLVTLRLFANPTYTGNEYITICSNQLPFSYGGTNFTAAGNYNVHLTSYKGCDSLIYLHLTVNPSYTRNQTVTICNNDLPYTYGNTVLYAAGTYNIHFSTMKGCDSLVILQLNVNPTYTVSDTVTICDNELPYNYGGNVLNAAGSYDFNLTTLKGCDSIIHLQLYVNPTYNHTDLVYLDSTQFPYTYGDSVFTAVGIYNVVFSTINACDSTILLTIGYYNTDTITICETELPYIYGNDTLLSAGDYSIHFTALDGLDSLVNLALFAIPTYTGNDAVTICNNELPYSYGDSNFTAAGEYVVVFTSVLGCDSIINLSLTVNDVPSTPLKIYGDTLINYMGIYTYYIDQIEDADSYEWTISNNAWTGSRVNNTLVLLVPTGGDGIISIKAINECGTSQEATLSIHSTVSIAENQQYEWTLGQNIPNPVQSNTVIPYSIPDNGMIKFNIMSVNGQVLYYEELELQAGSHVMELNIDKLANGIYYYSMEYQGQRIVKKMTIQR